MMTEIMVVLYSVLLFIALHNIVAQYKRTQIISAFICLQTAFVLYYIFVPLVTLIFMTVSPEQIKGFTLIISRTEPYKFLYAFVFTVIAYIPLIIVYRLRVSSSASFNHRKEKLKYKGRTQNKLVANYMDKRIYNIAVIFGIISLLIGLISELIIASHLGGVLKAISMGAKLRSFGSDSSVYIPQNQLFITVLMVFSLVSTYLFVYSLRIYNRISIRILLIISMFANLFYFFLNAGRLAILIFGLTFAIDYSFRKSKHPFVVMGIVSILALITLGLLDDLFFYMSYGFIKDSSGGFLAILSQFSFPYLNLLNVIDINELFGIRWGIDYFSWLINIIPTSILNIFGLKKITSNYFFMTEYFRIYAGITGGIPTDILTLSIRQFGLIGIIINSVFISRFCKYFDSIIAKLYLSKFMFMTLRIASIMFIIVPYGDLDAFVRNRYDMLLVLLFASYAAKIKSCQNVIRLKEPLNQQITYK